MKRKLFVFLSYLPVVLFFVALKPANAAVLATTTLGFTTYHITSPFESFADAEAQAVSLGGHLVTINSAAENTFLRNFTLSFSATANGYWIGLSDSPAHGGTESNGQTNPEIDGWVWRTGETLTATGYTNWASGEPSDSGMTGTENVVQFRPVDGGVWNDISETLNQRGLVEVVPEPSRALLLLVGAGGMFVRRRRG